MSIEDLIIIGESINDSIPSTHAMFEDEDLEGIVDLAVSQAEKGAQYIDVNVGRRSPAFMAEVVKKVQERVQLPLSIDTPDPELAEAGLDAYDSDRAGNRVPILNSISEARLEMFDIYAKRQLKTEKYETLIWATGCSNVISVFTRDLCLTELISTPGQLLPKRGLIERFHRDPPPTNDEGPAKAGPFLLRVLFGIAAGCGATHVSRTQSPLSAAASAGASAPSSSASDSTAVITSPQSVSVPRFARAGIPATSCG